MCSIFMEVNVIIVIQARLGSSRYPAKVLAKVAGIAMIERVLSTSCKTTANAVILAVPEGEENHFRPYVKSNRSILFGGSENNVLDRFYCAAKKFEADYVVRITADDPFKSVEMINSIIELCRLNYYDYVSNNYHICFPEGYDVEGFSMRILEEANKSVETAEYREHVTLWIRESSCKKLWLDSSEKLGNYRLTLDTKKDKEVLSEINSDRLSDIEKYYSTNNSEDYLKQNRSKLYKDEENK